MATDCLAIWRKQNTDFHCCQTILLLNLLILKCCVTQCSHFKLSVHSMWILAAALIWWRPVSLGVLEDARNAVTHQSFQLSGHQLLLQAGLQSFYHCSIFLVAFTSGNPYASASTFFWYSNSRSGTNSVTLLVGTSCICLFLQRTCWLGFMACSHCWEWLGPYTDGTLDGCSQPARLWADTQPGTSTSGQNESHVSGNASQGLEKHRCPSWEGSWGGTLDSCL